MKTRFRPEFINRLDEIVFFKPLTADNMSKIVDLLLKDLQKRLKDKELSLQVTPAAKDYIIKNGSDPLFGARPLKRYIQGKVETLLAKYIIANSPRDGSVLTVDMENGQLTVSQREMTEA